MGPIPLRVVHGSRMLPLWLVISALGPIPPERAWSEALQVDCAGGGSYTTIGAAVAAAATGDTILIAPCTYEEAVLTEAKELVFIGAGVEQTRIVSATGIPLWAYGSITARDLGVERIPVGESAIHGHVITLEDCHVQGRINAGVVRLTRTTGTRFVTQPVYSFVKECEFESCYLGGRPLIAGSTLYTEDSIYGRIELGAEGSISSKRDVIGRVELDGGIDIYQSLSATGSVIDTCVAINGPLLHLHDCRVNHLQASGNYWSLEITGSLLKSVEVSGLTGQQTVIEHNTILGLFGYEGGGVIQANIFYGGYEGACASDQLTFVLNLSPQFDGYCGFRNIQGDPLFCDAPGGAYTLRAGSPALGAGPNGSDIGAFGLGCATVDTRPSSWGRLKQRYGP